jgi:hypothetical protein
MLELWLMPQLLQDKTVVGFQRDGVPPHIHNEVTAFLYRQLLQLWIDQGEGSTSWPSQSPDLITIDFSMCGFVKDVYILPVPITLNNLRVD